MVSMVVNLLSKLYEKITFSVQMAIASILSIGWPLLCTKELTLKTRTNTLLKKFSYMLCNFCTNVPFLLTMACF